MLSWTYIFVNLLLAMLCQPKLRLQQSLCSFGWQSIAKCRLTNTCESWHIVICGSGWQKKNSFCWQKITCYMQFWLTKKSSFCWQKTTCFMQFWLTKKIVSVDRKPPIFSADKSVFPSVLVTEDWQKWTFVAYTFSWQNHYKFLIQSVDKSWMHWWKQMTL